MTRPFAHFALFAAALLFAAACGAADDRDSAATGETTGSGADSGLTAETTPEGSRLEHDGVSIELPNGWEGRILSLDYPSAVLQAANFEFVPLPGEEDAIKAMTAEHALVAILPCGIVSFEGPRRPAPERVSLDDLTFMPRGHPRVPRGHAFAHGSFDFTGRCLRIEADFGGTPPEATLTDTVNSTLASLTVAEK